MKFRSDMTVTLIDSMGSDERICQSARVSTMGADSYASGEAEGLISFLAREHHGSPFEHVILQWLIEAPIFVWREFMRHRIASYNEESGRYKELEPVFYLPARERPLVQVGKTGAYEFKDGGNDMYAKMEASIRYASQEAYTEYQHQLKMGIAREVARMVLPLNIYSSAYVTMNLRGLMNFLSLRTEARTYSAHQSKPQAEIAMVANQMEATAFEVAPLAMQAFDRYGRVCP